MEVLKQRVSASRSSFITTRPSAMTIATSEPRAGLEATACARF
jgi:hypothetical protein